VNSKNRYLRIDDLPYHHAGASEGQSIGFSLAAAVDSLRRLEEKGVNPTTSAASLEFMQHLDCEFFQGIAKLRATRMVWDQVRKTCSLGGEIRLHSRTSPRVLSQRDPWVNILRNTTSCFAGAIGGADAISTDSFDCRLGLPNQGGQRLARNTQLILGKESHLHQVIDPAGGAHFIESLTLELAKRAWAEFQAVEARGGMEQSLQEGWIHDEIEATKNSRQQAINKRKRAITGVSEFPHIREKISPQRPSPASTDLTQTGRTLRPVHFADAFEELRDRSDKWLLDHGERPKVGLLNLGPVSNHTGRSTFIQNLVEAGGFDTLTSGPITTSEEAIDAAKEMIGKPVILCCSNEDAKHLARPIAIALQKLNLPLLWLAGKPEEDMSSYTEAGIQQVVKLGDDMVLRLGQLWTNLEGK
jgi:methylmalonyl-CoA mutase